MVEIRSVVADLKKEMAKLQEENNKKVNFIYVYNFKCKKNGIKFFISL